MIKRGDCSELLLAADAARASQQGDLASALASACAPDKLTELVDKSAPEQSLLWCGRAAAAQVKGCEAARIDELASRLNPHLTLGPPDASTPLDPLLGSALDQAGKDLNLAWNADHPDVIVGKLTVAVDHSTSSTTAAAADAKGKQVRVPATLHRFLAKAEAQVELGSKTRTLRAQDEARDTTWAAALKLGVAARPDPAVPSEDELKKRAAIAWLRALAKALAASPPEGVEVNDAKTCAAYGLSLNLNSGDPGAAARGAGEPGKVAACERILGEPPGAGIPVP